MVKRTLPQNTEIIDAMDALKKAITETNANIWKRVFNDITKSTRKRREINLNRINKACGDNEVIVVPGKLLSNGELSKKLTIAVLLASQKAREKAHKAGCKIITIKDLIKKDPKGANVRIIG